MTSYTERSINTASIPKQLHFVDHGRLDKLNEQTYEVSILLAPEAKGKGIAARALKYIDKLVSQSRIVAQVHPDNIASQYAFKQAGFTQLGVNDWHKDLP